MWRYFPHLKFTHVNVDSLKRKGPPLSLWIESKKSEQFYGSFPDINENPQLRSKSDRLFFFFLILYFVYLFFFSEWMKRLIFFKIDSLTFITSILASFWFIKTPTKLLLWYGVKLCHHISFIIFESYSWNEFSVLKNHVMVGLVSMEGTALTQSCISLNNKSGE